MRQRSQGQRIPLGTISKGIVWSAAITALVARDIWKKRKSNASKPKVDVQKPQDENTAAMKTKAKPRRDYKVSLDPEAIALAKERAQQEAAAAVAAAQSAQEEEPEDGKQGAGQPEQAGPGPGGAESGNKMIDMLKSLGFRMVVPNDGSGQILMVPPGQKLEGEEEGAAGALGNGPGDDEEGFIEDEDLDDEDGEEA